MPIIEGLEQGSNEWHEFRSKHIMGTDVSVILGNNKWKSKLDLWEEKKGIRLPQQVNEAMLRGHKLEPEARALASVDLKIEFNPVVILSLKYPWLAVSLDGFSPCGKYILEIKCPKELTHLEGIQWCFPNYYHDQIQTQLLVSEAETCFYVSYRPEYEKKPLVIIEVKPNKEKHREIIEKSYGFYVQLCNMEEPKEWELNKRRE